MKLRILALILMFSGGSQAVSEPKLTLYANPLAFFSTIDEQGINGGYSVELSHQILSKAGLSANTVALPWARIMQQSSSDDWSLITGMVRTPERENNYHWITPISRNPVALYGLRGSYPKIHSLEEINQFESVAVLRDDYRQTMLDQVNANNIVAFNTWQQAIGSLLKMRVQGLFFLIWA